MLFNRMISYFRCHDSEQKICDYFAKKTFKVWNRNKTNIWVYKTNQKVIKLSKYVSWIEKWKLNERYFSNTPSKTPCNIIDKNCKFIR